MIDIMADDKLPQKLDIPKLRVSSHSFNDTNNFGAANSSHRTVSSSTSLLSTPSNNIRKVQQINPRNRLRVVSKNKGTAPDIKLTGVKSTAATTKKLLDLQKSKKAYTRSRPFVLHKPANLSMYDYSVFSKRVGNEGDDEAQNWRPLVKNSQIRAWESAEKITANIIFDNEKESDAENDEANESSDFCVGENNATKDDTSDCAIRSLPHYTKGELKVILDNFRKLCTSKHRIEYDEYDEAEKKALWIYRQQQSVSQERAFNANHTLQGKKKLQVFHKKELLHKLFGYNNSLNQEHITNNSSYSAYDNSLNAQKAFHEDKEEIVGLLEEDAAFESDLDAVRQRVLQRSQAREPSENAQLDSDNTEISDFSSAWLTAAYEREMSNNSVETKAHEDLEAMTYTISHLKQCVKETCDNKE